MTAETMAEALGGRKVGQGWTARCPAHDDREPSLSIRDADGKVLVRCHAGCDQRDVIAALKARGLWDGKDRSTLGYSRRRQVSPPRPDQGQIERSAVALSIWQSAIPADGTPVEAYLGSRGMTGPLPRSLRFHRGLKHPSGGIWPCMVALVTRGAEEVPTAIHRTFLARDGRTKAPVEPAKMMLGPCKGGAVRLSRAGAQLIVGEGIESTLSAMMVSGLPGWAALSTSGMKSLELPALPIAACVTIAADADPAGKAAACEAAERWHAEGRTVKIATPPPGLDFNDLVRDGGADVT